MTDKYCPNCNCDKCQPIEEGFEVENEELRNKVLRLESHVIAQDKLLAEYAVKDNGAKS